jgi:hypothetical protein
MNAQGALERSGNAHASVGLWGQCRWAHRAASWLALLAVVALGPHPARAEGDERLGPVREGFLLAAGDRLLSAGVGLHPAQPGTIRLEVHAGLTVLQALLHWAMRSERGDGEIQLNGAIAVRGELIGQSTGCPPPHLETFAYRADITGLGLIGTGSNELTVAALSAAAMDGGVDGAGLTVIAQGGGNGSYLLRDGCDFAVATGSGACQVTERQRFEIAPASFPRPAELLLMAGDHSSGEGSGSPPSTIEVLVETSSTQQIISVISGSDGAGWDTVKLPFELPSGAGWVEVQLFKEQTPSVLSPSSFFWILAAVKVEDEPEEPRFELRVEEIALRSGECGDARVLLTSNRPVQGFTTAVRHDPALLSLSRISIAGTVSEANLAEFFSSELAPNGGTAGVILDAEPPFLDQKIPPGSDLPIVAYRYCCRELAAGSGSRSSPLELVDGSIGTPPKDNIVVVEGRAYLPVLVNGSVACSPSIPCDGNQPTFLCGGPRLDVSRQRPIPIGGGPGDRRELSFYYHSPEDHQPGHAQFDHLQGVTMVLCYDCNLEVLEDTFRIPPDTMTAALEADYVAFQADNDPDDGDGCEMILGILIDVVPPYDGKTLPPTPWPLKLAAVDVRIRENAPCSTCLPVEFCDGANGRGRIPLRNLYAAENHSFPACTESCRICVLGEARFIRGDCNSTGSVNIADPAAIIGFLFLPVAWQFEPPCLDACDANDDGRVDLADAMTVLIYLFRFGPEPPPPGPHRPGPDPTPDKLGCGLRDCE